MSRRYAFLLTPTWLGWLAVCAAFAVACYFLGQWQWDRREQTLDEINTVVANYDEDPIGYSEARELFVDPDEADEWTVVEVTGRYLGEDHRFVRNRPHTGDVGYEQLVPFRVSETGDVIAISRGWLPLDSTDGSRPAYNPEPPGGEVDVVVRLRPAEPAIDRGAPEGQLASIDLNEYDAELEYDLLNGGYGVLASEDPAPAEAPRALPRPSLDEGPHLSYSMQWIAFGLLGFVGWGYAARLHARNRDLDAADEAADEAPAPAGISTISKQERIREAKRRYRQQRGRYSDEDAEDAWVDEHLTESR
ncbi:SURF1 family protein [Nesterenkonia alba]|uniref:SURF1 family cytochrome oxidase biogenesis protein n=1 Tax=Nesterenkonia alba TaxID=515814 RepID=UPI0003B2F3F6|nr:SURF1 family protein [Nesterenkonia alba]